MMLRISLILLSLIVANALSAGTLIYKTTQGETKTISDVTLLSLDNSRAIIEMNGGTEILARGRLLKYFDSDLRNAAFDDSSADYTIRLGRADCPATGLTKKNKRKITSKFIVPYNIDNVSMLNNTTRNFYRHPYFYLAVLVANDNGSRSVLWYSYPKSANCSMRSYDEVKMLEKVLSLSRPRYYPDDAKRLKSLTGGRLGGEHEAIFELSKVKDRKILAWHLLGWGKNEIVVSKGDVLTHSVNISKNWWIR